MKRKRSRISYIIDFLKSAPTVLKYKLFRIKPKTDQIGEIKQITMQKSSGLIFDALKTNQPFAAIRFGAVELSCLNNFEKIRLGFATSFKESVVVSMKKNAGFFPTSQDNLSYYSKYMFNHLPEADILGISGIHMEHYFYRNFAYNAQPVQNWALDPLLGQWSHLLKGRKVLVISPFADQIEEQYKKRERLFPNNPGILPQFELITIKAVQTIADQDDSRFGNWFEALDYMKVEILKHDFDVALIGAGAYGTPLCLYVKSLNKQAIQTGGATQLLFGIIGKRWEQREYVKKHINKDWIRPKDKPTGYHTVEKGCYW
ncbi:MAG TPA: hypothetical protein VJZ48_00445 [Bacilli bacterium]|nr:hypothetical protein [Bacilli bacterium]